MFSFLKRTKSSIKIADPMHFIGKYPIDPEYIKMGGDDFYILETNAYLESLHEELICVKDKKLSELAICYFLEVDASNNECVVGRVGPSQDKSERDNLFMLARHVVDEAIKKYPLFIPSLYDDFFKQSDVFLKESMAHDSLSHFQDNLNQLNQSSVYLDKAEVLNASIDALMRLTIKGYRQSLLKCHMVLSVPALLGLWRHWRHRVCDLALLNESFPLKIELPSDDNLNYYVSFICQVIEPLFESLDHYRIFWWRDELEAKAWCLISNTKKDPKTDLQLFNNTLSHPLCCLTHGNEVSPFNEPACSLLDALQVVDKAQ